MSITRRQVVQLAGASPLLASAASRCLAQAAAPPEPPRIISGSAPAGLRITNAPVVIPPKGKFRSIPVVAPIVFPPFYKLYDARVNIITWSDGALVRNSGSQNATMICSGAGHEPSSRINNTQGNLALEVEIGKPANISWRNAPTFAASDNDVPSEADKQSGLMANHRLKNTHAYQSFEHIPEGWGLGKNMVFRFRATGIANGGNRPCIYDISRSVDGEHLLTDSPVPFDSAGKNLGNAYVMTCRDDVRKGFWVCEPMLRGELILLKPFIDSDGSFRTSVQYWPGIAGNSGQALFHIPELDYLVCVSGASFRGNWGGKNFAYLAILSPGATPAAAKTWRVGYVPEKGAFWPNATYDGWYGNAKQINSFTIRDKGTKYIVGDKVFARVRGTIKVINGSFQWVDATVKGQAGLVVTKVDDAGGIREVVFQTVDYQGFPLADNGYFSSTPGSISNGQAINMPLDGTVGSGATIDCVMVPSISALEVQKLGLQWVASRRAAYGWVDDIDAKAKPVKLSIPRNPTVDNWIINSPSLSHDETDVNGDPDLVYAVNGTYRKTRYWPEQDVWIRFVSVERNPQIISMD